MISFIGIAFLFALLISQLWSITGYFADSAHRQGCRDMERVWVGIAIAIFVIWLFVR